MDERTVMIVFIGRVGSGKSTHMQLLRKALEREGVGISELVVKTTFVFTSTIDKFLHLLGRSITSARTVWKLAVTLDLLANAFLLPLVTTIRIRSTLPPKRVRVILVEEHLPGIIVDYIHLKLILGLPSHVIRALRFLVRLLGAGRTPTLLVYLYCNEDELRKRWSMRGTPPEHRLYLRVQDIVFEKFYRSLDSSVKISTMGNIVDVNKRLLSIVHNLLVDSRKGTSEAKTASR